MHKPIDTISSMKRANHRLWIAVGFLLSLLVVDFYSSLSMYSDYEYDMEVKQNHIIFMEEELEKAEAKLKQYEVDEKYITELGATPDQAKKIIKASEAMDISPKY